MDILIDSITSLPGKIIDFFGEITNMIGSVYESLCTFREMLNEFDATVVAMTESCQSGDISGMPLFESIGLFRYLVGDVAFYMIYFSILVGCLFTIYKLVTLLFDGLDALTMQTNGVTSKTFFSNLVGKVFGR